MAAPRFRLRSLFAVVVLAIGLSGCGYNTIPTLDEDAKAKWAEVQNQYQRRADLIPNLVSTVQGLREAGKGGPDRRDRGAVEGNLGQYRRLADHRSREGQAVPGGPSRSFPARSGG